MDQDGQMLMLDSSTEEKQLLRHHDQDLEEDSGGEDEEEDEEEINVTWQEEWVQNTQMIMKWWRHVWGVAPSYEVVTSFVVDAASNQEKFPAVKAINAHARDVWPMTCCY